MWWPALNSGSVRTSHLSLWHSDYSAISKRISLRIHHNGKPTLPNT
ncbi:hypothetical protein ACZ87_00224 [Candidatus Erwinia dacicola]|uniref:Uncharacterized protein n=1 Tax=Candidatus Erwinia dacicola TaxID=252393 RepID=A0A328TQS0_9GAMM|nr:hypothetical protein ACZ87_00224 [Candidatus Erwinia dacicola]